MRPTLLFGMVGGDKKLLIENTKRIIRHGSDYNNNTCIYTMNDIIL